MNDELVPLGVIAEEFSVSRQCLSMAIRKKRLKARMHNGYWHTTRNNFKRYLASRFTRDHSTYNGEKVYDDTMGRYSLRQAADMLLIDYCKLYYACQLGEIKPYRIGKFIVLDIDEIKRYGNKVLKMRKQFW